MTPLDLATARTISTAAVASVFTSIADQGTLSAPWQLPTIPQSLPACSPSATFTSAGAIQVSWSWDTTPEATGQQVTVLADIESISSTVQKPNSDASFAISQASGSFIPGQIITIKCTSLASGVVGDSASISYTIPYPTGWDMHPLDSDALVGTSCTMTSLAPNGINSLQLWWASTDGSIQTAVIQNGSWHATEFATSSTVSTERSCLTSTSRDDSHQEMWWVAETGAISGQYWLDDGAGWRPPSTGPGGSYPFDQPNQACTTNGGSTASMSRGGTRMDLWWIDPAGGIGNARWNQNSGWGDVFSAAPAGTAAFSTFISQLTAQSLDGQTVDVFYIGDDGSVGGACSKSPDATTPYSVYNLVQANQALPSGGISSMQLSSQQVALFWVTPQTNIEMAILTRDTTATSGWTLEQQSITEHNSTLVTTGIAVSSTGSNQFSLWWAGQYADLRRIDVDLTTAAAVPWPVVEQLSTGGCRQTRTLLFQSVPGIQSDLWYVNPANVVQNMSSQG